MTSLCRCIVVDAARMDDNACYCQLYTSSAEASVVMGELLFVRIYSVLWITI